MAPHWHVNAHSMIYITQGSSRFQVANHQGKLVFDGEVKEGQIILVPQNFVVLKKAGKQGCEWVAFKTNDNAMTTFVAGRLSAIRAMPVEVLMNSYQISRNDAKKLKYSREELGLFGSKSRTEGPRAI
ncbi:12S seed storage protein CRA1 [Forsythia ovata]|uniref:12S seed storage protein CRA1 n=1 Tax=Forsythia ovata TaxID=205694 RepID=A0ABD1PIW4_9LAMI